nr:hypothetical protein [Tanacetum cinerariifolium]
MTTLNVTSSIDSQMHNNIMAVGSRDRLPMLATGRYPQWRSQFLRYVNTRPNGDALRKFILSGPYKPTTVLVQAIEATDDSPAVSEHTTVETPMNMSPENKAHFKAEKEAIHQILTGIGDEIYSTVDACQIAQEMWKAIERLQQEWLRFVNIVKQQHKLDEVSYHKLFDILKQYQNKVNEFRAKKLARNANPLALVATAQANQDPYYQTSRSHRSQAPSSKPSIPTRSHTATRHKGKEIAKPITPPSEIASEEDIDPEQAQRDKDMQKNLALIAKPEMYRIDNRTAHTRATQLPQTIRNANFCVSTSTGVNHKPNVSRPQLKSNQSRDKVLPNNSQVKAKKTQVEVHPRIPSVSNKIKSVSACKDSLNSRTLNANAVCATCNKCLVDSNHFACVTKMLNDVNARTKKPTVVPISTRKPKSQAIKSVATHHKKKVASKSTKQKPQSYYRKLYEITSKIWK